MGGFSTIGGASGGGVASQVNYSITAATSQTVSALYLANNLVDVAGLLVAIQNTAGSAITLTAASGAIVNTASNPTISTATTVTIQPNQTIVLETNLANLDYFIVSSSTINEIFGGAAGQLLWQQSPNNTGFIPAGAAGQMLVCGGTSIPTWQPISVPNVQGGFAGEILYQSATNSTAFVLPGTTGQVLVSNGTSAPSWANFAAGSGTSITNTGTDITLKGTRSYTLSCSNMTSGQSFPTFLSGSSIPDTDGNQYTVYNNTSSTFSLVLPTIVNYQSYNYGSQAGNFINGSTVGLLPNQSINFQTYSVGSSSYTIMDTTNAQQWGFEAQVGSMGALPASTDTLMNFNEVYDPTNSFDDTNHAFTIPKTGVWIFNTMTGFSSSGTSYTCNIQLRKNGSQFAIGFFGNGTGSTSNPVTLQLNAASFCNVGDIITVTNWVSVGSQTPLTANGTMFSGILGR